MYISTGHSVYAVDPTPSPAATEADCDKIPEGILKQNCISYSDTQSGFPYHPCNTIRDPLTGVYTQLMEAGRTMISSMLPSIIADSPIFRSIFQSNIDSAKSLSGTLLTAIPNTLFEMVPNKPADMLAGYGMQYHSGCVVGNICAQSRNLSAMGIEGDNLCIPESEWGAYIDTKLKIKNNPGLLNVASPLGGITAERLLAGRVSLLAMIREEANSIPSALSRLCFRSTPNGDRILSVIVNEQIANSGQLPLMGVLRNNLVTFGASEAMRILFEDRFLGEKTSGEYIRTNANTIKNLVNKPLIGGASTDIFPTYKVQDAEMNSLWRCVSAAQDSKLFTAIGNLPVDNLGNFVTTVVFGILLGVAGATTLLCVIYCAIMIQMSQGGESMGKARDTLMHCLMGLALIIFATFLLRFIGVDLLRLPGLS